MPPSQQVELMETVSNLKKAIRRAKQPFSQPIYSTSNRGNKLKKGASHVRTGALASTYGPQPYKLKIEHAGYTRYILDRNPIRYNEYGDELSDNESDEDADADAAEESPYDGIRIEELLRPLTHPAELATHPTLSIPYLDPALPDMVKTTEEKLRQERANLWRAKNLNRQLLGDEAWMPCAIVESPDDWDLFEPRSLPAEASENKRRKLNGNDNASNESLNGTVVDGNGEDTNGVDHSTHPTSPANGEIVTEELAEASSESIAELTNIQPQPSLEDRDQPIASVDETANIIMEDAEALPTMNGDHTSEDSDPVADQLQDSESPANEQKVLEEAAESNQNEQSGRDSDAASPAPPPRRITRALAANNNPNTDAPTPPLSPTPTLTASSTSSLLQVDPSFLLPDHMHGSNRMAAVYGLPIEEALETRKLLTAYIQKQEECVRGYETVLAKLIKALKMRADVFEWCKAEGHVGEMSDGEDWIDYDHWGLQPGELRKGKYEEEDTVEETAIGGRKKGRRRQN